MSTHVTKVQRKGIIVIPKALREEVGLKEGDIVIAKAVKGKIIIEPLESKVKLVAVDHSIVDRIVREINEEEKRLEKRKLAEALGETE